MGTITVNIRDDVEDRFRSIAGVVYGRKKGHLGNAVNEAFVYWMKKKGKRADTRALALLEKGFEMGSLKFDRDELHKR